MNKLLITGWLLATAFAAAAMPTKKELAAAQKLVEDVIAPDVKALNAGRKTVKDVADIQMKLAADAQSEAEKYLLLQSAFKLYSRGEEFDSAAKALTAIIRDIKDVPPELITELVDKEFNRDIGLKAPKEIEAVVSQVANGGSKVFDAKAIVDGCTWSYRVKNGEAEIYAVSLKLKREVAVPLILGGAKVTSIGERSFRGLGMTSVLIPASVTSIGAAPFAWCGSLTRIDVAADNHSFASVGGVLCTKDLKELVMCPPGLTTVTVPESVKTIRAGAFHGCKRLVALAIPFGVEGIKTWAFSGCRGLTSVVIPASVTNMEDGIFWDCFGLTLVTMRGERPIAKDDIFKGCRNLKSIHVPANAKSWAGMKEWQGIPLVFDAK